MKFSSIKVLENQLHCQLETELILLQIEASLSGAVTKEIVGVQGIVTEKCENASRKSIRT